MPLLEDEAWKFIFSLVLFVVVVVIVVLIQLAMQRTLIFSSYLCNLSIVNITDIK